jgi:hypothetical protein
MNDDNREPQAPESYPTFWEPIVVDPPPPPPAPGPTKPPGEAKDAYQEFTNVTEDTPVTLHVERI